MRLQLKGQRSHDAAKYRYFVLKQGSGKSLRRSSLYSCSRARPYYSAWPNNLVEIESWLETMRIPKSETSSTASIYQSCVDDFLSTCPTGLVQVERPDMTDLVGIGGHQTTLSGLSESDLKDFRVALFLHRKFLYA
jgi:hypothetical protein